jgi:hypothetical protein
VAVFLSRLQLASQIFMLPSTFATEATKALFQAASSGEYLNVTTTACYDELFLRGMAYEADRCRQMAAVY